MRCRFTIHGYFKIIAAVGLRLGSTCSILLTNSLASLEISRHIPLSTSIYPGPIRSNISLALSSGLL